MDIDLGHVRYHGVADHLRTRILDGTHPPGSQLPSEEDLTTVYGCGRDTIRDALAVLAAEGLIVKERGRRAVITTPGRRIQVTVTAGTTIGARMPMRPELAQLDCPPGTPLLDVRPPGDAPTALYPATRVLLIVT